MLILKSPARDALVSLASNYQKIFSSPEQQAKREKATGDLAFQWYDLKATGDVESSQPAPVRFSFREVPKEIAEEGRKIYTYLLISESDDMRDPILHITDKTSIDVYNLKIGTRYFWCIQKNGKRSEIRSFTTKMEPPRCIHLDTVSNVRDLGGYPIEGGGRVRQGLLYRGSEFEFKMHLSPKGVDTLRVLGIKTVLDLRGEAIGNVEYSTAELFGIRRIHLAAEVYDGVFRRGEKRELHTFFSALASKKNYPIYFHCRGGADRTGTYAFILGALYGMSREDLMNEYEFTSLSVWGTRVRNYPRFSAFLALFDALPGETMSEKARTFLRDHAGLTDRQIETIYTIAVDKIAL